MSAHGGLSPREVARASGEANSVLTTLREAKPGWLAERDGAIRCTEKGYEAFCRELGARRVAEAAPADVTATYARYAARREPAKREFDQVYASPESALARARRLLEGGETQRGLCLLGDDDLTSVVLAALGVSRRVTVLEIDPSLVEIVRASGEELSAEREVLLHDLRDPVPEKLRGRFGAVFTDPPYAIEGFTLFIERATELLREDGRLLLSFGQSRRSAERGLEKQRALLEAGYFIEEIVPDLVRYEGAESIGASSALYICRRTPRVKSIDPSRREGDLYSRRAPRPKRKP